MSGELGTHLATGDFKEANGAGLFFGDRQKSVVRRPGHMRERASLALLFWVGIEATDFPAAGNLKHAHRKRGPSFDQVFTVGGKEEVGVVVVTFRGKEVGVVAFDFGKRSGRSQCSHDFPSDGVVQMDSIGAIRPSNEMPVGGEYRIARLI